MSFEALSGLIQERRSIRRYSDAPIEHDLIMQLLEMAVWAPSAHNRQPWRFTIIQSDEIKEALAIAMGNRLKKDLSRDGVTREIIDKDVSRSYERITSAPVLILICLSMVDMDTYSDKQRSMNEHIMAIQSTAMAGQNLLLTAHALGLGACWMCAPLFCPDIVKSSLNLPDDWEPQGLITVGYPAQSREKTRHPLEKSILWR